MKSFLSSLLICLLLFSTTLASAATHDDPLIALASDALVNAGSDDWERTKADLSEMVKLWSTVTDTSPEGKAVEAALAEAERTTAQSPFEREQAYKAVSALAKTVDDYVSSHQAESNQGAAKEKVNALVPDLQKSLTAVQAGDFATAKKSYERFISAWAKAEGPLRKENFSLYSKTESKISGARIALNTQPPNQERAEASLQELISLLQDYVAGNIQASDGGDVQSTLSISDIKIMLNAVETDLAAERATDALSKMDQIMTAWPSVEFQVLTRSPAAYSQIETKMTAIPSLLLSSPPDLTKASSLVQELQSELEPFVEAQSYTAWDAGLILFREGLEAILVISALLAFLSRSGNADKRKWIWTGAGAGLLGSGVLAIILSVVFSNVTAGSSRELLEGYTGLIAVIFMITVGAWLHNKSNLRIWNQFIERTMGAVIARGALWSLAATVCLAVLREGAETIIFYLGMASTIATSQLLLGIGGALALLAVIAFAILRLSVRIPIRPFFLVASLLLYYLAFKFVGVSVHALQVAGQLPSHLSDNLPQLPSLGIYASWETTIPQLVVLAVVLWSAVRAERKKRLHGQQQKAA